MLPSIKESLNNNIPCLLCENERWMHLQYDEVYSSQRQCKYNASVANKLNHVDENNYTEAYMKMLYIQEDIETD